MRRIALVVSAMLVGALAAGGAATLHAQQTGTIKITAPAGGASVSAPVTVSVQISGVTVKPAAEGDPNAFHYHLLVDVDPATVVQAGQPLPTGQANIIHTADSSVPLANLAPGQHTVTAVLTKTDHVPLNPSVQDRVQFTVAAAGAQPAPAAGAAPATPRTGTGISGRGTGLPLVTAVVAAVLAGGGLLLVRRRRSA